LDVVKLLLDYGCDPTDNDNLEILYSYDLDLLKLLFRWYLARGFKIPKLKKLNKIKQEIIHETFLIYELKLPEELCHLIQKFT
jgi:hypothetical protein